VLELGGQLRLRLEDDNAFDVKGCRPATTDTFLLSRVMLDADLQLSPHHRVFLELRDARETGSRLGSGDFPTTTAFNDPLDVRQLYWEGTKLSGSLLGVRLGRQQISYGDQRVFGAGKGGSATSAPTRSASRGRAPGGRSTTR
jgi:hypothetical protein